MLQQLEESAPSEEPIDLTRRPRRNRKSAAIRALTQENRLHPNNFVAPLFILEGEHNKREISSMPGISRLSIDFALKEAEELYQLGIRAVNLFIVIPPEKKDPFALEALRPNNLLQKAVKALKKELPDLCIMVDAALDPYTDHGHDGIVDNSGNILNDKTLKVLGKLSVLAAEAGADIIAPSDMMDGRIGYIRQKLDQKEFHNVGILSYAAKYASSFYGPFRDALHSSLKFGDKKTYQLNPANAKEAMLECSLDEWEGADMLMIKPALPYLDILSKLREQTELPIGAYHVSGEYSMIMAAAEKGWLDAEKVLMESLLCIKRAGANFIFTYGSKKAAEILVKEYLG